MEARNCLYDFLQELNLDVVYVEDSVEELIECNFHALDEGATKKLIDRALKERDSNVARGLKESDLLGSWGVVIDTIKEVTMRRRDRASDLLQVIVTTGVKSGPKELERLVFTLASKKEIDRVLIDLIETSLVDCRAQGNATLGDILNYAKHFLDRLKVLGKLKPEESTTSPNTATSGGVSSSSSSSASKVQKSSNKSTLSPPPTPTPTPTSVPMKSTNKNTNLKPAPSRPSVGAEHGSTSTSTITSTSTNTSTKEPLPSLPPTRKSDIGAEEEPSSRPMESTTTSQVPAEAADAILKEGVFDIGAENGGDSDEEEEEEEEDDEEEEEEEEEDLVETGSEAVAPANPPSEAQLIAAGELLRELLRTCAGDATSLKSKLIELCMTKKIGVAFQKVVSDNIEGCKKANYVNKLKVLQFMQSTVDNELSRRQQQESSASYQSSPQQQVQQPSSNYKTMHHAPQFVDDALNQTTSGLKRDRPEGEEEGRVGEGARNIRGPQFEHVEVSLIPESNLEFLDVQEASVAMRCAAIPNATIPAALLPTNSGSNASKKPMNNKKKSSKKAAKKKVARMATAAAKHLEERGWAVLDNFLPAEVVKRVRVESGLFQQHYENAEIWVGKQADVGAHLSVPSVRGDKVLWMCGGHSSAAPEGVSRTVRTINEVEPCKLEVKAAAPIRRFTALKELVASCDALMDEMKLHCTSLSGVYERSDAMLAIYPGEGAKFAKHIDNTTGDGRRLTCLVYLNPEWIKADGGALRLFPPTDKYHNPPRSSLASSANASNTRPPPPSSSSSSSSSAAAAAAPVAVDIMPECGRLAMFYSADIPHEVLPTFGQRHSITLWYYDHSEREQAVEAAKADGTASKVASASVETQQQAKLFIAELMGGDEVAEDGGDPTEEELSTLRHKVTQFGDEVLGIVAAITGAPSVESFRAGFPMLSTQDLKSMRALFRRMGLGSYSTTD